MKITEQTTLCDVAVEHPTAIKVLDRLHIDYSCDGKRPIADACSEAGLQAEDVIRWIVALENREGEGSDEDPTDWTREPLQVLTRYIVEKHHTFLRDEFTRLTTEVEHVVKNDGAKFPELAELRTVFLRMRNELLPHMLKEEQILFPYIVLMEDALSGRRPMPMPPFGSLENPIRSMLPEHDDSAEFFEELRRITHDFAIPAEATGRHRMLIRDLEGIEWDLQHHLHLENNILFPRAVKMEKRAAENAELEILGSSNAVDH